MPESQQNTMKIMAMVMLPLSLLCTAWIPSGIQLYFMLTGGFHFAQTWAFYQPWFRRLVGLAPLAQPGAAAAPAAPIGSWQAPRILNTTAETVTAPAAAEAKKSIFTDGFGAAKTKLAEMSASTEEKATVKNAKEYEEKRALEQKEGLMARRRMKRTRQN